LSRRCLIPRASSEPPSTDMTKMATATSTNTNSEVHPQVLMTSILRRLIFKIVRERQKPRYNRYFLAFFNYLRVLTLDFNNDCKQCEETVILKCAIKIEVFVLFYLMIDLLVSLKIQTKRYLYIRLTLDSQ